MAPRTKTLPLITDETTIQDADFTENDDELSQQTTKQQHSVFDDEPGETPDDVAFMNILADLGDADESGSVNVYKQVNGNFREQMFLFRCAPSEFDLQMLQDPDFHKDPREKHTFRLVLRNSTGIVTAKTVSVMPVKKVEVLPPSQNTDSVMAAIQQMQRDQQTFMTALVQSLQQQQKPQSQQEFLQTLLTMKELLTPTQPQPQTPTQNPLEILGLARELAETINPDVGGSPMMRIMEKVAGPLLQAAVLQQNQPPQRHTTIQAPPATATAPVIQPNPIQSSAPEMAQQIQENQDMNFLERQMLNASIGFLIEQAKRNADPDLYADLVIDQAGDDIESILKAPDWFERLSEVNSNVIPHKAWFVMLKDSVLQALTEDENNDNVMSTQTAINDNDAIIINDNNTINPGSVGG